MCALASAYHAVMRVREMQVDVEAWKAGPRGLERLSADGPRLDPKRLLASAPGSVVGVAFRAHGSLAFPLFDEERGLHAFVEDGETQRVLVHTSEVILPHYEPPGPVHRRGFVGPQERCRSYLYDERRVEDAPLGRTMSWTSRRLDDIVAQAVEMRLRARAEEAVL